MSRAYRSPLRAEQAAATRTRILEAARALFVSRGFAGSTLQQVADEAGVALPTVTGLFASKARLLEETLRTAVRGGDESDLWNDQLTAVLDSRDSSDLARSIAAMIRSANERSFDLFEILRKAAAVDPELEARRRDGAERRRRTQARIARHLVAIGATRPGLSRKQAADILWLYSSADVYRLLVADSGWSPRQYEGWLRGTLEATLLAA